MNQSPLFIYFFFSSPLRERTGRSWQQLVVSASNAFGLRAIALPQNLSVCAGASFIGERERQSSQVSNLINNYDLSETVTYGKDLGGCNLFSDSPPLPPTPAAGFKVCNHCISAVKDGRLRKGGSQAFRLNLWNRFCSSLTDVQNCCGFSFKTFSRTQNLHVHFVA